MITAPPRPASCRWPPTAAAVADLPHVPTPSPTLPPATRQQEGPPLAIRSPALPAGTARKA